MFSEDNRPTRIPKEFRPKPRTPGVVLDETLRSRATAHRERLHVVAEAARGSVEFLRQMELSLRPRQALSAEPLPIDNPATVFGVEGGKTRSHRPGERSGLGPSEEFSSLVVALKEELSALQSENAALQLFCARFDGSDECSGDDSLIRERENANGGGNCERTGTSLLQPTCQTWRTQLGMLLDDCEVAAARHCDRFRRHYRREAHLMDSVDGSRNRSTVGCTKVLSLGGRTASRLQRVTALKMQSAELLQQCSLLEADLDAYRREAKRDAAPTAGLAWDLVDEVERAFPVVAVDPVPRMAWQLRRDLWKSWKAEAAEQLETSEELHYRLEECVQGLREQMHMIVRHLSSGATEQ